MFEAAKGLRATCSRCARSRRHQGAVEILLCNVMERGRLLAPHPALTAIRDYCAAQVTSLPEDVRRLRGAASYPVSYSQRLVSLQRSMEAEVEATELAPAIGERPGPAPPR